jgi:hypothetical protein
MPNLPEGSRAYEKAAVICGICRSILLTAFNRIMALSLACPEPVEVVEVVEVVEGRLGLEKKRWSYPVHPVHPV